MKKFATISFFYLVWAALLAHFCQGESFGSLSFFLDTAFQFCLLWLAYLLIDRLFTFVMKKLNIPERSDITDNKHQNEYQERYKDDA